MEKETLIEKAARLHSEKGISLNQAAKELGVPPSSLYAYMARREFQILKGKVECPCCGSLVESHKIKKKAGSK